MPPIISHKTSCIYLLRDMAISKEINIISKHGEKQVLFLKQALKYKKNSRKINSYVTTTN